MTDQPETNDRPNRYPWPPIIYVVALAAGLVLDRIYPVSPLAALDLRTPALVVAGIGLGIGVAGFSYFQAIGTTFDPTGKASRLATGGIYRLTRNPMYLGACVFFVGFGIVVRSGWLVVLVPVIAVALQKLAILPEEAYLTRRFGAEYKAYCAKVRRWV